MKRYNVRIQVSWSGEVEATTEKEAKELAIENIASGGFDVDDFMVYDVQDDDDKGQKKKRPDTL